MPTLHGLARLCTRYKDALSYFLLLMAHVPQALECTQQWCLPRRRDSGSAAAAAGACASMTASGTGLSSRLAGARGCCQRRCAGPLRQAMGRLLLGRHVSFVQWCSTGVTSPDPLGMDELLDSQSVGHCKHLSRQSQLPL